ncbi:FHA domain-containing protein [Nocardioides zeae]|uniref:FHA domain-containing protein n=1 Tax=Nocardioides zeae TaxID=1457234 RepID=A0A6P0HG87_9ACTN|nr:FHA domain-containing protein [Nocardioides zeae]NEN77526.1 FHA domain-containing protein [Nocardioides zeae]
MWVVVVATVVGATVGVCSGLVVLVALLRRQEARESGAAHRSAPVLPPRAGSYGAGDAPAVRAAADEVTTPVRVRPAAPEPGPAVSPAVTPADVEPGPRRTRPLPTSVRPLPMRPVSAPVATPAASPAALRAARPAPRPGPPPVPGPRRDPRAAPVATPATAGAARSVLLGDEIALVSTSGLLFRVPSGAVVGRSRGCRVRLADARVSRQHAVLYKARGGWWIGDLGSTNGTFVDGVQVQGAAPVREGSTVLVGGTGGVVLMALRAVEESHVGSPTAAA